MYWYAFERGRNPGDQNDYPRSGLWSTHLSFWLARRRYEKGGDIDLLILSSKLAERDKRAIRIGLCRELGEQKIDLVIACDTSRPFVQIALAEGKEL